MPGLWHDIRHSLRLFARAPGFTATAMLVLAVGIGTNTAVFTATNVLLFKPLGGQAPGALVGVFARVAGPDLQSRGYRPFSHPDYRDLLAAARGSRAFDALMAQEMVTVGVTEGAVTRKGFACLASSSYFTTLAVVPSPGRAFLPSEDEPTDQPVVVVSHAYASRNPGTAALGRIVTINNRAFTIVGVAPEGFSGTTALLSPEFWIPLGAAAALEGQARAGGRNRTDDRARRTLLVAGRLRPGLSMEEARPLMAPVTSRLREAAPAENRDLEVTLGGLSRFSPSAGPRSDSEVAAVLAFLMGMAAIVLLIACLNLANMLLARGATRGREIAIRMAVGGTRARVIRQMLTESAILSGAGAVLGLLLSWVGTGILARAIAAVMPLPLVFDSTPDLRVLVVAAGITTASTLAFGLGPALRLSKTALLPSLKHQAGQPPALAHRVPIKNLLVVGQLALCLMLLTAAGLFVRGAFAAGEADPGFPLERGLVAAADAGLGGYDEIRGRQTYSRVLARLRRLPGIEAASLASAVPFGIEGSFRQVRRIDGATSADPSHAFTVVVGTGYFKTVGLPLLRGRDFSDAEEQAAPAARPVVVDVVLADRLWPNADPLGQRLQMESPDRSTREWAEPMEVVGVVAGVRDTLFDKEPGPHVYVPFGTEYRGAMHVHAKVRATGTDAAAAMTAAVRRELRAADVGLPVLSLRTLREHRDASIYVWMARASAQVFATFGLSALLLSVLGVYGVKAYLVSRRTREIGIRVALGATRLDILALVLKDGLWLTAGGLSVGVALSVALSRVLGSWVYGVTGIEPIVLLVAGLTLAGTALLACYLPARRAIAVAPAAALRAE